VFGDEGQGQEGFMLRLGRPDGIKAKRLSSARRLRRLAQIPNRQTRINLHSFFPLAHFVECLDFLIAQLELGGT
jgi:hypothetical protein